MKRIRLSTLLFLIVIVALVLALVVQERRVKLARIQLKEVEQQNAFLSDHMKLVEQQHAALSERLEAVSAAISEQDRAIKAIKP